MHKSLPRRKIVKSLLSFANITSSLSSSPYHRCTSPYDTLHSGHSPTKWFIFVSQPFYSKCKTLDEIKITNNTVIGTVSGVTGGRREFQQLPRSSSGGDTVVTYDKSKKSLSHLCGYISAAPTSTVRCLLSPRDLLMLDFAYFTWTRAKLRIRKNIFLQKRSCKNWIGYVAQNGKLIGNEVRSESESSLKEWIESIFIFRRILAIKL